MFKASPEKDKTLIWFEDAWHGLNTEPEIDYIIENAISWIKKRI